MDTSLSVASIARALVKPTAFREKHVSHLLLKLGLRDRIQAVIFAYESGLTRPGEER